MLPRRSTQKPTKAAGRVTPSQIDVWIVHHTLHPQTVPAQKHVLDGFELTSHKPPGPAWHEVRSRLCVPLPSKGQHLRPSGKGVRELQLSRL